MFGWKSHIARITVHKARYNVWIESTQYRDDDFLLAIPFDQKSQKMPARFNPMSWTIPRTNRYLEISLFILSCIMRQRSPSRHLWRIVVQRLVDHCISLAERTINRVIIEWRSVILYGEKKGNCCGSRESTMFRLPCSMNGVTTLLKTSRTGLFRCSVLTTSIDLSNAGMQYGAYEI